LVPPKDTYAFENTRAVQLNRLRALEAALDAQTTDHLESIGVGRGWRCLEVGAGGGSIADWLCDRVAPEGTVLATDLDTTVLDELSRPNLEVRVHDVLKDDLPEAEFDLIHLRLLLAWLTDPNTGLRRLAAALKPGGWLIAEEMDFVSVAVEPRVAAGARETFERVLDAHNTVLAGQHAFDPYYGRRVLEDLEKAGLTDLGSQGRAAIWRGGDAGATVWRLTFMQLREAMLASGLVSEVEIDEALALCEDPDFRFLSQITMTGWGRRATRD
jgi:ubiquinone/menaquinone biosynthesis C-methylase UbiE